MSEPHVLAWHALVVTSGDGWPTSVIERIGQDYGSLDTVEIIVVAGEPATGRPFVPDAAAEALRSRVHRLSIARLTPDDRLWAARLQMHILAQLERISAGDDTGLLEGRVLWAEESPDRAGGLVVDIAQAPVVASVSAFLARRAWSRRPQSNSAREVRQHLAGRANATRTGMTAWFELVSGVQFDDDGYEVLDALARYEVGADLFDSVGDLRSVSAVLTDAAAMGALGISAAKAEAMAAAAAIDRLQAAIEFHVLHDMGPASREAVDALDVWLASLPRAHPVGTIVDRVRDGCRDLGALIVDLRSGLVATVTSASVRTDPAAVAGDTLVAAGAHPPAALEPPVSTADSFALLSNAEAVKLLATRFRSWGRSGLALLLARESLWAAFARMHLVVYPARHVGRELSTRQRVLLARKLEPRTAFKAFKEHEPNRWQVCEGLEDCWNLKGIGLSPAPRDGIGDYRNRVAHLGSLDSSPTREIVANLRRAVDWLFPEEPRLGNRKKASERPRRELVAPDVITVLRDASAVLDIPPEVTPLWRAKLCVFVGGGVAAGNLPRLCEAARRLVEREDGRVIDCECRIMPPSLSVAAASALTRKGVETFQLHREETGVKGEERKLWLVDGTPYEVAVFAALFTGQGNDVEDLLLVGAASDTDAIELVSWSELQRNALAA